VGDHRAVLLDNNPPAIIGYDEAVQIEIEAILHSGTVDLGDEPSAAPSKPTRSPIATSSCGVCRECLPAATDMDPKLIRERRQAALQGLPIG
jgi:hypothetical protein